MSTTSPLQSNDSIGHDANTSASGSAFYDPCAKVLRIDLSEFAGISATQPVHTELFMNGEATIIFTVILANATKGQRKDHFNKIRELSGIPVSTAWLNWRDELELLRSRATSSFVQNLHDYEFGQDPLSFSQKFESDVKAETTAISKMTKGEINGYDPVSRADTIVSQRGITIPDWEDGSFETVEDHSEGSLDDDARRRLLFWYLASNYPTSVDDMSERHMEARKISESLDTSISWDQITSKADKIMTNKGLTKRKSSSKSSNTTGN